MTITYIIGGSVLFFFLYILFTRNRMQSSYLKVDQAFADLDVMLTQRFDLLTNLIKTVKQYMTHEEKIFTRVSQIRTGLANPNITNDEKISLHNQLSEQMPAFRSTFEAYPSLQADKVFLQLQRSMNEVEENIQAARRNYNASVTKYNTIITMFPTSIFAGIFNFRSRKLFEAEEHKRDNINVDQLFG